MRLGGAGAATSKRYTTQLDLRALKLEEGDELQIGKYKLTYLAR